MCAERNAIGRAVSEHGKIEIAAVVVVRYASPFDPETTEADISDLPTPSVSPCGVCRQTLREFTPLPLNAPVYMLAATYPYSSDAVPDFIKPGSPVPTIANSDVATTMTLGELLPMSFGPEALAADK